MKTGVTGGVGSAGGIQVGSAGFGFTGDSNAAGVNTGLEAGDGSVGEADPKGLPRSWSELSRGGMYVGSDGGGAGGLTGDSKATGVKIEAGGGGGAAGSFFGITGGLNSAVNSPTSTGSSTGGGGGGGGGGVTAAGGGAGGGGGGAGFLTTGVGAVIAG